MGKVALVEVMLAPSPSTPSQGTEARGGTPSRKEGVLQSLMLCDFVLCKREKIAMQSPQLAFLRNSAWCDRPASAEPAPSISRAQGAGRTEVRPGFLSLGTMDTWARHIFGGGTVLCILGCLAASWGGQ